MSINLSAGDAPEDRVAELDPRTEKTSVQELLAIANRASYNFHHPYPDHGDLLDRVGFV